MINSDKALNNAIILDNISNSKDIFIKSFVSILKIDKNNWKRRLAFGAIETVIAIIMSVQKNTIPLAKDVFQLVLSVDLALLAIVFTGYSIFQALINDKLLVVLVNVDKGNLAETNRYFVEVMFFQIGCLMLNICLLFFCMVLPDSWCLFHSNVVNTGLAAIGAFIILHINIEGIWEMKSFIFNMYQLFNLHSLSRIIEIKEKEH